MGKFDNHIKWIPFIGYLGFFLMQIIVGLLLIGGLMPVKTYGLRNLPNYQPLTYLDLLILLSFNIPTFIIIVIAIKKTLNNEE